MNILFVYNSPIVPENGGVQRVTHVLSTYFEEHGHHSFYLSLNRCEEMDQRQFVLPNIRKCNTSENVKCLTELLKEYHIDIIINQDGLNPDTTQMVLACRHNGIPVISVAHNSLTGAVEHFRYSRHDIFKRKNLHWLLPLTDILVAKKLLLWMFKKSHQAHFLKVVNGSDRYVLLSDRFNAELEYVIGEYDTNKVIAISNPCTIEGGGGRLLEKEKIVLYVGRIDYSQKRNDLLLKIWERIERQITDWKLVIVGDGGDLDSMKGLCTRMHLSNVEFVGKSAPQKYYEKASVFCLTSAFEGFSLTLVEAMSYGVTPCAFDSYASLRTIIDDGINGVIVPAFDIDNYASRLIELMKNDSLRNNYAQNALEKAKSFSLEAIGQQWLNLFKQFKYA